MISKSMKIIAVSGVAVFSLGLTGPAFAGSTGSDPKHASGTHAGSYQALTVDELRAYVTKLIANHLAWIAKAQARVPVSTELTAAQKTAIAAKLTAKAAALTALKAQVAAAATKADLRAAVDASGLRRSLFHHQGNCDHGARHDGGNHDRNGSTDHRGDRSGSSPSRVGSHR